MLSFLELDMKKGLVFALSLSLISTSAFAQTVPATPTVTPPVQPQTTVIAAVGGGGLALALLPLLLLALLAGGKNGGSNVDPCVTNPNGPGCNGVDPPPDTNTNTDTGTSTTSSF